ncbi:hypothetical protein SLEP1_g25505 [Rubroshorea leprosula]|uniref:Protein kinase domain-containing protein n=1 Tax=Rubroshorea leprosula TaxID=152421 RepID=A0AAV5JTF9_9ROSI|nr:hypothetical protein SLEP1_g25505 [Rubroshorea leprosula]
MHFKLILGASIGILAVLFVVFLGSLLLFRNLCRNMSHKRSDEKGDSLHAITKSPAAYSIVRGGHLPDEGVACHISLSELVNATNNFRNKIGKGSFGSVYYGQMQDGKEVAVKIMADSSSQLTQQFVTEVVLCSAMRPSIFNFLDILLCMYDMHCCYIIESLFTE